MEAAIKTWTVWVAIGVEAAAVLVIAIAALEAVWRTLMIFFARPPSPDSAKEGVRLRLARWLAVALEFALAADILRTAISPTWEDIGKLAAIATLRTVLNFFLQREIETAMRHEQGARTAGMSHAPSSRRQEHE
ncbi:MAG: DUF1622 domain-containing protein [Acetobacteraceae bacterium]